MSWWVFWTCELWLLQMCILPILFHFVFFLLIVTSVSQNVWILFITCEFHMVMQFNFVLGIYCWCFLLIKLCTDTSSDGYLGSKMALLRRRKVPENVTTPTTDPDEIKIKHETKIPKKPKQENRWSCLDNCCWFIGCICVVWWGLLFSYNMMPSSFPLYVTEAITGPMPDSPGVKLKKEGLRAKHPVVFVPGIVTGGLELWEGHSCADRLFRKRLWGGSFGEIYKRWGTFYQWFQIYDGGFIRKCIDCFVILRVVEWLIARSKI